MSRDPEQDSKSEEHSDDSKCAPETEPRRVDGELPAPGDPASPPAPAVSPSALATAPNLPPATPHASTPTTAAPAAGQELPIAQANEIQPVPETSQRRPDGFRDWVIERLQLLYSIPQKLEDMIAENEKRQAEAQEELFELVRKRRTLVDKREPVAEVIGPYLRKL
jgi:hypothetical protein